MDQPQSESEAKLQSLAEKANRTLFSATARFPFQLVPDRIVVDETKVTVEYRNFLRSEEVHTFLLQDINTVELTYVLFLATITITGQETCIVPFLRREDAIKAKQIITGLQVARREHINLSEVPEEKVLLYLLEIGRPHVGG